AVLVGGGAVRAQEYPSLAEEIHAEHPLLIFPCPAPTQGSGAGYGEQALKYWESCPSTIRDYAALSVSGPGGVSESTVAYYREVFSLLQDAQVPAVLRLSPADQPQDLAQLEELLRSFTFIRGLEFRGVRFNAYPDTAFGQA